ncbi:hypothetical protein T484DRAFT_1810928, partial [Baffinella frigidus]
IPVPDVEFRTHEQDLRIHVGCVAGWVHVSSSENRGSVVLDFDFPHVTGLTGAAVIAAANNSDPLLPDRVWTASTIDRALVSLRLDVTRLTTGRSALFVEEVLSEFPLQTRAHTVEAPPAVGERHARVSPGADAVLGIAGAVAMEVACDGVRYCFPSVISSLERSELECGAFPPWPAPRGVGNMGDAACQDVSYAVGVAAIDNTLLLSSSPAMALDGSLTFAAAAFENGVADLDVTLSDSAGAFSPPRSVTLLVLPVNQPPRFTPETVITGQDLPGIQQLIFARNVSAGAKSEDSEQKLTFEFTFTQPRLFSAAPYAGPNLTVATLPSGEKVGYIRFASSSDAIGTS